MAKPEDLGANKKEGAEQLAHQLNNANNFQEAYARIASDIYQIAPVDCGGSCAADATNFFKQVEADSANNSDSAFKLKVVAGREPGESEIDIVYKQPHGIGPISWTTNEKFVVSSTYGNGRYWMDPGFLTGNSPHSERMVAVGAGFRQSAEEDDRKAHTGQYIEQQPDARKP